MLKPIPNGPMKKEQKQFRDSASENRSEQESRKDLDDGRAPIRTPPRRLKTP